ncbi:MAG TPA: hypothetical protein VF331_16195 [Polyangiales bacterium]
MADSSSDTLIAFVEHLVAQLAKNGYPERRVAFPIERMYESAAAKGLSFNKVLEVLAQRGIGHEKTPEKVIFAPAVVASEVAIPSPLGGFDPAMLEGMSQEQLMAAAQAAMQQMNPDQLAALQSMLESMTPEQQAAMVEQARKLGLA